jgi:hypothetical protein
MKKIVDILFDVCFPTFYTLGSIILNEFFSIMSHMYLYIMEIVPYVSLGA